MWECALFMFIAMIIRLINVRILSDIPQEKPTRMAWSVIIAEQDTGLHDLDEED
jgi:hypothetical protein